MTNLFQQKRFKMHSGGFSDFKLECDALTKEDYETLAFIVSRKVKFCKVLGIPRGGLQFGEALEKYEDPTSDVVLIADDVFTTGGSMLEFYDKIKSEYAGKTMKGIVVFSRGNLFDWVDAIFSLNKDFWQND